MTQINTVAELKRTIRPCTRLACTISKGANPRTWTPEKIEEWKNRAVTYADTTGLYLKAGSALDSTKSKRGSFCPWPLRKEFTGGENAFTITNDRGGQYEMVREYTII